MSKPLTISCPKCEHIITNGEPCPTCRVRNRHKPKCKYRRAVECRVAIECEHGYDVCPICDPCTCKPAPSEAP